MIILYRQKVMKVVGFDIVWYGSLSSNVVATSQRFFKEERTVKVKETTNQRQHAVTLRYSKH